MNARLEEIERRYCEIEQRMQDPNVVTDFSQLQKLGKQKAELEVIVGLIRRLRDTSQQIAEVQLMLEDPEMREMAQEELERLTGIKKQLEDEIRLQLLPKDPNDERSVVIEIRAAAGGDEAALFANELFRMYTRYAERRKWKVEVVEHVESGIGGADRVTFTIEGKGAYSQLKYESGVHRVQRVPATENSGRIHTSTVTVAVLPEAEEVDVEMDLEDVEISTFRASSAGGQHVQKNETAIRAIHKPTGLVATCQDERSQQQNKLKALQILRTKLYQMELDRANSERAENRRSQIGTGERSEKIRTYNFPQSRITDHRTGMSVHNINSFLDGDIQEMLDSLISEDQRRQLAEQPIAA
jgi:peptide chain release factor 1